MRLKLSSCILFAIIVIISLFFSFKPAAYSADNIPMAKYWARVDLTSYPILCIEDFTITDIEVDDKDKSAVAKDVSGRMIDYIINNTPPFLFDDIRRGYSECNDNAVIMRIELTNYSAIVDELRSLAVGVVARSSSIDFIARFIDAMSGEELTFIDTSSTAEWQKRMKDSKYNPFKEGDPSFVEQEAAIALGMYLTLCKKQPIDDYRDKLVEQQRRRVNEYCNASNWATIYIIRAQGFVGSGTNFTLGINDLDLGVCQIRSAYVVKVQPGKHDAWTFMARKHQHYEINAEAGASYFLKTTPKMNRWELELLPESKGRKSLNKCNIEMVLIYE